MANNKNRLARSWGGPQPRMWLVSTLMLQPQGHYAEEKIKIQAPTMPQALRDVAVLRNLRREEVLSQNSSPNCFNPAIRALKAR